MIPGSSETPYALPPFVQSIRRPAPTTAVQRPVMTEMQQPETTAAQQPVTMAVQQPETTKIQQPVITAVQQPVTTAVQQSEMTKIQQPVRMDSGVQETWKEAAGRIDGNPGYQFGDFTRSSISKLKRWSNSGKGEDGYQFGDLFLKDLVNKVLGNPGGDAKSSESAKHKELAVAMNEKRQKATELFQIHLPQIEKSRKDSIDRYKKAFDDLNTTSGVTFDACFVRLAEESGNLPLIQKSVDDALNLAEECAKCVNSA